VKHIKMENNLQEETYTCPQGQSKNTAQDLTFKIMAYLVLLLLLHNGSRSNGDPIPLLELCCTEASTKSFNSQMVP
jgi:hypothetical protein